MVNVTEGNNIGAQSGHVVDITAALAARPDPGKVHPFTGRGETSTTQYMPRNDRKGQSSQTGCG